MSTNWRGAYWFPGIRCMPCRWRASRTCSLEPSCCPSRRGSSNMGTCHLGMSSFCAMRARRFEIYEGLVFCCSLDLFGQQPPLELRCRPCLGHLTRWISWESGRRHAMDSHQFDRMRQIKSCRSAGFRDAEVVYDTQRWSLSLQ